MIIFSTFFINVSTKTSLLFQSRSYFNSIRIHTFCCIVIRPCTSSRFLVDIKVASRFWIHDWIMCYFFHLMLFRFVPLNFVTYFTMIIFSTFFINVSTKTSLLFQSRSYFNSIRIHTFMLNYVALFLFLFLFIKWVCSLRFFCKCNTNTIFITTAFSLQLIKCFFHIIHALFQRLSSFFNIFFRVINNFMVFFCVVSTIKRICINIFRYFSLSKYFFNFCNTVSSNLNSSVIFQFIVATFLGIQLLISIRYATKFHFRCNFCLCYFLVFLLFFFLFSWTATIP